MTTKTVLSFMLGLMYVSTSLAQSDDPLEELKGCAEMTDPEARSSCYEDLGKRVLDAEPSDEKPAAAPVAAEATKTPAPLPDDLGGGQFSDQPEPPRKEYRGLVTTCQKGADGFWYFRFENGQVWKHVNIVRRSYRDCGFHATITEERMGHKMQIEGDDNRVRVTRIR